MSNNYFTAIVLPGGCEFMVKAPADLKLPYFPIHPEIRHSPDCKCIDKDGFMDDDTVFTPLWLSFWSEWNARRVLAPELRGDSESRHKARAAFCHPEVERAFRRWDLPTVGFFRPSSRTLQPIKSFWQALGDDRDLAHCQQPSQAVRFYIDPKSAPGAGQEKTTGVDSSGVNPDYLQSGSRPITEPDQTDSRQRTEDELALDFGELPISIDHPDDITEVLTETGAARIESLMADIMILLKRPEEIELHRS
ncbi:hypothetical protein BJ170DRAFT_596551 [Xylariales sp. AK1849]|nr:hypothetical protein BJ170DRAFT_596551 [Xylariales sp. AK1849]